MEGPRSRSIRLALAVTLTVVAIGASTAMTVAQPEPSASPEVHGWPGAKRNPAGLYSWTLGSMGWMHNVNYEGTPVEIAFEALDDTWSIPVETVTSADTDPEAHYNAVERVSDTRIQAWLVDLPEARVSIIVRSFPESDPALIAEAGAIVESVRVEHQDDGISRLVFMLPEGWDSG